jgi:hypothetical protein
MRLLRFTPALMLGLALVAGCGGANKTGPEANTAGAKDIDADPIALFPGSAISLSSVDAKAFFQSGTVGAQIGQLSEAYLPVADDAGFKPSRDVDRVVSAAYITQGVDSLTVLSGRFDEAKIKRSADAQTPTKSGTPLVRSQYAGRDLYTMSNVGFVVLSPRTVLLGSEGGIRRALDRVRDGKVNRDIPKWMIDTVETQGAAAAMAADLSNPVTLDTIRRMAGTNIPATNGIRSVRLLADFKAPGMNVAGSMTYGEPAQAQAAEAEVKSAMRFLPLLAVLGINLRNVELRAEQADVQVKFAMDESGLRGAMGAVAGMLPPPAAMMRPQSPPPGNSPPPGSTGPTPGFGPSPGAPAGGAKK